MSAALPYGSTALLRVDPQDYAGQDIVPVFIGRKAPSPWSRDFAADGMFSHGDTMVWIHDLDLVDHCGSVGEAEFLVPETLSVDNMRAIPMASLAGVGQGLEDYMEVVSDQLDTFDEAHDAFAKRYRMRAGTTERARSTAVLMSTNPKAVFPDVDTTVFAKIQTAKLSNVDKLRAPLHQHLFDVGTIVREGFQAPLVGSRRSWRGKKKLDAEVVDIATFSDRRHRYQLKWRGSRDVLLLAGVPEHVDEGYVERHVVSAVEPGPD